MPAVTLITDFTSVMATIVLVADFVRRTLEAKQTISALEERSRLTLESYNRLLTAEQATNAVRHEMRHHMTALSGILEDGDTERARRYIASVSDEMNQIPAGRYSRNILVNVIAGTYLGQARKEGIQVEYRLDVPEKLNMEDEDLSVFFTNMLQNALEACEKWIPGRTAISGCRCT